MKPAPYNPDAKISAAARSHNASARVDTDDPVRSFSQWELDELRRDLLSLTDTLRRDRLLTLLDQHARAEELEQRIADALSGDADLDGLEQKITDVEDNLKAELDPETALDDLDDLDDLGERLLTVTGDADFAKVKDAVVKWYGEQLERIRKEVTEQVGALNAWRVDAKAALDTIDPLAD